MGMSQEPRAIFPSTSNPLLLLRTLEAIKLQDPRDHLQPVESKANVKHKRKALSKRSNS